MDTPLRDLRVTGPCALVLFLAACATVAAHQSGAGDSKGAVAPAKASSAPGTAASSGSGAPAANATPPVPRATPLPDGSYRDLLGNKLVPPAVMIGGRLEPVHGAVSKHLGIDPSKASMIVEVIPGLPAAKAGLEAHDILIAVEGLPDANEKTIRQHLRTLKAGDRIGVTYRRGNDTRKTVVVVEPWHPDHMVRPLRPEHFSPLPSLAPPPPASQAQLQALEQRVAALEKEVAELRRSAR
ncbi:MAG: PDZ domain-containing protein [Phycisphaerae bacterium]|nr:PDZ domain-containing protein [Phycisphaerae bacterium]